MRTLVVSDLHLGANSRADLMRRPELRAPFIATLREREIQRLVVLGDGLELREVPVRIGTRHARDVFAEVGQALGEHGEVVVLAGNHDHAMLSRWHDARRLQDPPRAMEVEHRFAARMGGALATQLAEAAAPAKLSLAYPGVWLRDDVYATHGHYLDLHTTVPTIERLAAGAMERFVARIPEQAGPDDYEATLAPLYAWAFVISQRATDQVSGAGRRGSQSAYRALTDGGAPVRRAAMRAGFFAAVQAINAAGIGPVAPKLSPVSLRRGSLEGMGEVVRRLGIDAAHVVFGHSHRPGPLPADDLAEWRTPTGARLHNTGSWCYQPHFLGERPEASPYRPGTAVLLEDDGPPQLLHLLDDVSHATLRPPAA